MTTTYRPAGTSALERMNTPTTCGCCGREDLKATVKLAGSDGSIVWMGTGCAAKAMGVGIADFRTQAKAADKVIADAEAAARKAISDAADAAWGAFLDEHAGPGDRFEQIQRLGGFGAATRLADSLDVR